MIAVQNVSKRYELYNHPADRLRPYLPFITHHPPNSFWALHNVSFRVDRGEVVAILGPNGSGKSTLLQIISGILQPTQGRVLVSGRIAALLELGAGFNPEFTGRENVFLSGEILGFSYAAMERKFAAIEEFAEIGAFIDRPVKEYSTGMYVRLAFSTAIHVDPEVLIVDEALAVGDAIFANRCIQKFEELRARNVTVLLVSHDLGLVKRLADRGILMVQGRVVAEGAASEVVNRYVGLILERQRDAKPEQSNANIGTKLRHGDERGRIIGVDLLNELGVSSRSFAHGDKLRVIIHAEFREQIDNPVVGILIRNRLGMDVFGTNSRLEDVRLGTYNRGEQLDITFSLPCQFNSQEYTLTVAVQHWDGWSHDWIDDVLSFQVVDHKQSAGVVQLPTQIEYHRIPTASPEDLSFR